MTMTKTHRFLGLLTAAFMTTASANQSQISSTYNFRVLLDEKPIGYHQFELSQKDSVRQVSSTARFDVKLLFITAFKYRHSSSERWKDNCLTDIDAQTDSNGKRQNVTAKRVDDVLKIDSSSGTKIVDGCVQTFAYWNPDILEATQLLNSQTGDYVDIAVTPLGTHSLKLGAGEFEARKFKLESSPDYDGKPVDITLWYQASDMQWLALESAANGGRTLRYELTDPMTPSNSSLPVTNASAKR